MGTEWPPLGDDLQGAYLRRLGLEPEPPSPAALQRLVRRQVERVPYETMWIAAGEGWGIDPVDAAVRIASGSRGGYCYHLNGAFASLLCSLGYTVGHHVGGVHGPEGPNPACVGNHLVLTVRGLPSDASPSGAWYVDVGLGDVLYQPWPLVAGAHEQAPFRLSLEETGPGEWHLTHDPTGGFTGMSWGQREARLADFTAQHEWLSTSPESGFVRVPMAERRDATGVDVLRGLTLARLGSGAVTAEPVTRREEWFAILGDVFGIAFHHSAPEARDRLWQRVVEAHELRGTSTGE
jgi:arylamine N-acetyltransferase